MKNFYTGLKPVEAFLRFSEQSYYARAPEDWLVVITDVEGSTKAIEAGKYKWVNMVGASSIVALVNALGTRDFPFVFGGDGATALIPDGKRELVERYLRGARQNALEAFGLKLRIGMISHRELLEAGTPVEVARYAMASGPSLAFFRGQGLGRAETWVKSGKGLITDGPVETSVQVLRGLSCRWAPLKSSCGVMLSIIVKPRAKGQAAEEVLRRVAERIHQIVDLESPQTHPVKEKAFVGERLLKAARAEAALLALRPRALGVAKVLFEMLVVKVLDRFGLRLPGLDFRAYKRAMCTHSDYRKYDEQLRMVLDCTREKSKRIREHLESEQKAGTLYFGLHESSSALMTCFLQSFEEGGHIHFVDGSDGGYALAAKELKAQMVEL